MTILECTVILSLASSLESMIRDKYKLNFWFKGCRLCHGFWVAVIIWFLMNLVNYYVQFGLPFQTIISVHLSAPLTRFITATVNRR